MPLIQSIRCPCPVPFAPSSNPKLSSSSSCTNHHFLNAHSRLSFHKAKRDGRFTGLIIRAAASGTDYYSTLNLRRNASLQDIKSSYRRLARMYHPDLNKKPGAEDKFKEISAAYEVLSDNEKRSLYDRFGEAGLQGEGPGVGKDWVDPSDIFNTIFGGSSNAFFGDEAFSFNMKNMSNQDLDLRYDLHLSLEESVFGGEHNIEVSSFETCNLCGGTGAKSHSCIKSCSDCGGRGGVMKTQRTPFGMMSQVSTCSKCHGEGKMITDHCKKCSGNGKLRSTRSMKVVIPPGVTDGATMQIQGDGNIDEKRGIAGDLFITIHINEKRGIWRDGLNLYSNLSIDYTEAILGTTIKVDTVEGLKDLHIPPGVQPGKTVKLPRMGVPDIKKPSVRGDHHFIVNVMIPKEISNKEKALVEELASLKSYGISKSRTNKDRVGDANDQASARGVRPTTLWNSISDFLRGSKEPGERFASVTVGRPLLICKSSKPHSSSLVISMITIIVVTQVLNLFCKIGRKRLSCK